VCALAAGFWALHLALTDELRQRLDGYEKSGEWQLPRVLQQLGQASASLDDRLKRMETVERLTSEREKLLREVSASREALRRAEASVATLAQELSAIRSDDISFKLTKGISKTVAGSIPIGLSDVHADHRCDLVVNNKSVDLKPGGYIQVDLPQRTCRAILQECNFGHDFAEIRWLCKRR
jgi:hypothetical protein